MVKEFKDSRFFFWLAVIGTIGFLLILLLTRKWGLGVTAGSMFYVEAARNFVSGVGFSVFSKGGTLEPLVFYPPGFPFLLSWGWFLGMDAFHWARFLNAFFFGVNIFLAGVLAWSWSKNKIAGLVAAGFFLVSPQLMEIHLHLLSEPVVLVFLLIFFIALSRYEEGGEKKMFYAASCSAAVAGMLRPIEMAFVVTAWAVFFSAKGVDSKGKGLRAGFFLLIVAAFPVIWCLRNILLGEPMGVVYPFSVDRIYICLDTFSTWLLPKVIPDAVRWVVMGLAIGSVIALWHRRKKAAEENATPVLGLGAAVLFMVVCLLFCFFHMPLISPVSMAGNAILSPILALGLIVLACEVVRADVKKMIVGVVILFALVSLGRCVNLAVSFFKNGEGYSSRAWTESKVLRELRAVDERVTVYTNDTQAVYYLIGRPAIHIPEKNEDGRFFPSIPVVSRMFEGRVAVGVIFNEKTFLLGPSWQHLRKTVALKNVMSDGLASIYVQKKTGGADKTSAKAIPLEK